MWVIQTKPQKDTHTQLTPDMLTRETLDQRENPIGDGTHDMMY